MTSKTMQIICLSHVARLDLPCIMAFKLFFCLDSRATLLVGAVMIYDDKLATCQMVYANDIMHINIQMKAANIYMAFIYIYICKAWIGLI